MYSQEALPPRMRAVQQTQYGSADVLGVDSVELPQPADDEVLLEVRAAGIDRGTWHLMTGLPYLIRVMGFGLTRPKSAVPGLDVAGVVRAVGSAVTEHRVGDEVFGISRGSFAEFAVAKAAKLVRMPPGLSFEQAGVATISGITAVQALEEEGGLEQGQRVLILGASGGVGSFAVQIAAALGAHVTGVCSTAKLDFVRSLGADEVIDYTATDPLALEDSYDLILDIGGRLPVSRLRRAARRRGTIVFVGGENGNRVTGGIGRSIYGSLLSTFVGQRLVMMVSKESTENIARLAEHIASGVVKPAVERVVDLDGVADALRDMEAGTIRGKVAVVP